MTLTSWCCDFLNLSWRQTPLFHHLWQHIVYINGKWKPKRKLRNDEGDEISFHSPMQCQHVVRNGWGRQLFIQPQFPSTFFPIITRKIYFIKWALWEKVDVEELYAECQGRSKKHCWTQAFEIMKNYFSLEKPVGEKWLLYTRIKWVGDRVSATDFCIDVSAGWLW